MPETFIEETKNDKIDGPMKLIIKCDFPAQFVETKYIYFKFSVINPAHPEDPPKIT